MLGKRDKHVVLFCDFLVFSIEDYGLWLDFDIRCLWTGATYFWYSRHRCERLDREHGISIRLVFTRSWESSMSYQEKRLPEIYCELFCCSWLSIERRGTTLSILTNHAQTFVQTQIARKCFWDLEGNQMRNHRIFFSSNQNQRLYQTGRLI